MRLDQDFCHCSPHMSAQGAVQPFADRVGKLIFAIVRQIHKRRLARRAVLRTITREQQKEGGHRRLSMVMWDMYTGSSPYGEILLRTLHPAFWVTFLWDIVVSLISNWRSVDRS
jgi:hypothetical protein